MSGCGEPLAGKLETGVFFPGHFILGLIYQGRQIPFYAAQVYQVVGVCVSGLICYVLAKELKLGRLGALVSGVLWVSSFQLTYHIIYTSFTDVMLFLPLLVLLCQRALHQPSPWALAGAGLAVGVSLLAGNPQWTMMHLMALGILYLFWQHNKLWHTRRIGPLLGLLSPLPYLVLCGLLIAAVQLIPAWELTGFSPRQDTTLEFVSLSSFSLTGALQELLRDNPFGRGGLFLLLAGMAPLLVRSSTAWGLLLIAAGAVDLAQGEGSALFRFLFHNLPGFGLFRFPGRILHLAVFALALLAGMTVQGLWQARSQDRRWPAFGLGLCFAVCLWFCSVITGNSC